LLAVKKTFYLLKAEKVEKERHFVRASCGIELWLETPEFA